MAAASVKALMPGVMVRYQDRGNAIRFSCMINGKRFQAPCALPFEQVVKNGKPTQILKDEYATWAAQRRREAGYDDGVGLGVPSCKELLAMYEKCAWERNANQNYHMAERSIDTALKNFRYCFEASGLSEDRPYTALMATDMVQSIFDYFVDHGKTGTTSWSYIAALQSVTSTWAIRYYQRQGYDVKAPVMPDVGNAKKAPKYHKLSPEQIKMIEDWYTQVIGTGDDQIILAAFFVYSMAMRPIDVPDLTRENFYLCPEDGYMHLRYLPKKTKDSSGKWVDYPMPDAYWDFIKQWGGKRLENDQRLVNARRWAFTRLNQSMRVACPFLDPKGKAVYELRKLCIDTVRRTLGVEAAVALSGDRRATIDYYYSDPQKVTNVTPVVLVPMGTPVAQTEGMMAH